MAATIPLAQAEDQPAAHRAMTVVRADPRTGRLVRKTVVTSPVTSPVTSAVTAPEVVAAGQSPLREMIESIAEKNQVETPLVYSVIRAESNYNPLAVSDKGAQGLMQLIPATAKRFGVKDSFDSKDNVEGGVKYLKYLIGLYHGDYSRAVAAYNAGEGAVAKYGGVPPYKETQNYVAQVARHLEAERRAYSPHAKSVEPGTGAEAAPAESAPETYNPVIASVSADGIVFYRTP